MTRPVVLLYATAALLGAVGLAALVAPPYLPSPDEPPSAPELPAARQDAIEDAQALLAFQEIVQRNVLDANRTPPARRFTPNGPVTRPAPAVVAPRLRLYGVATGPTGAVALIDADPTIPGAEIYRVGDRVGTYQLESIEDTFVTMTDSSGSRILRLEPAGRSAR